MNVGSISLSSDSESQADAAPLRGFWKWPLFWIVLVALLAEGFCLNGGIYMDDEAHITANEAVVSGQWWTVPLRALPTLIWTTVGHWTYFSPMALHALNLLAHVVVSGLAFLVGRRLIGGRAAFVGALLFACHPLATEAVNYTAQLSIQLVTLWALVSIELLARWIETKAWRWPGLLAVVLVLAAESKEIGLIVTGVSLMLALGVLAPWREFLSKWSGWLPKRGFSWVAVAAGFAVVLSMVGRAAGLWAGLIHGTASNPIWVSNFLTQCRLFWKYAAAFFCPYDLCSDHHLPLSESFSDAAALWGFAGLVALGLLLAAGFCWRRTRMVALLGTLAVMPLCLRLVYANAEFFVEYRAYPALPWACLLVGVALVKLTAHKPARLAWMMAPLVLGWTANSMLRCTDWSDPVGLAEECLLKYPTNNRARAILIRDDFRNGDFAGALIRAQEARQTMTDVLDYNESHRGLSGYETTQAFRLYAQCEQFATLSMGEARGSKAAMEYADHIIKVLAEMNPEFVTRGSTAYEVGGGVVRAREFITEHASRYDEKAAAAAHATETPAVSAQN